MLIKKLIYIGNFEKCDKKLSLFIVCKTYNIYIFRIQTIRIGHVFFSTTLQYAVSYQKLRRYCFIVLVKH